MDGYINDVQGLLRNVENNYVEGPKIPYLPYSCPINQCRPISSYFDSEKPGSTEISKRQHLFRESQQQYFRQDPGYSGSYQHNEQHSDVLDDYGKSLDYP